jgi:non-ribosomal peptide synthetase component E (peptide arylation enzyme)
VLQPEVLAALVACRMAAFKVPTLWKRLQAFPLTGSGKVQKFRLRELFDEGAVRLD